MQPPRAEAAEDRSPVAPPRRCLCHFRAHSSELPPPGFRRSLPSRCLLLPRDLPPLASAGSRGRCELGVTRGLPTHADEGPLADEQRGVVVLAVIADRPHVQAVA